MLHLHRTARLGGDLTGHLAPSPFPWHDLTFEGSGCVMAQPQAGAGCLSSPGGCRALLAARGIWLSTGRDVRVQTKLEQAKAQASP